MLLGCIADDLTGATDLALMLVRGGMRTVQVMDVPKPGSRLEGYDAVVVALKTRTCPVGEAVDLSLRSCDALLALGARQIVPRSPPTSAPFISAIFSSASSRLLKAR